MRTVYRTAAALLILAALASCGGREQPSEVVTADSMEDALALAKADDSFVVVEFWMDG